MGEKAMGLKRLIRAVGSGRQVATALGMSEEQVSRVRTGRKAERDYFEALAELLELVPMKDWPERWRR